MYLYLWLYKVETAVICRPHKIATCVLMKTSGIVDKGCAISQAE
nr:MAG TPA: hypothetical protein [Caudoviricetes sp.]